MKSSSETEIYQCSEALELEFGGVLEQPTVAYRTWGELDAERGNAVILAHGLTGTADADDWWKPLIGPGRAFDTDRDFIIATNALGSCYGTTGPLSLNPSTGDRYGASFPRITIRDMVALQKRLTDFLGVSRVRLVAGGSLGGMQALEWAAMYSDIVETIAPIATSGRHSAWCIGFSEAQRQAIFADPDWRDGHYDLERPPARGLSVARMIAMISYRARDSYEGRFGRELQTDEMYAVESYLRYQGEKLVRRFDANAYVALTRAMDTHDVSRGRGEYLGVLRSIEQPALVVAIDSDVLYPPHEQAELAREMPNARYETLSCPHGHDSFLIAMDELNDMIVKFRKSVESIERVGTKQRAAS